ncbi:MAG: PAS domain-containing protein [Lachnospiraceae bacterium]|nr:PAS domain-containing protein [Lachnospiraceae bacterium]
MAANEEAKELLLSIVDNIIVGVCMVDIDSTDRSITIQYMNDGFFRMIRTSRAEAQILLHNVRLSIVPEDMAIFEQGIDDCLADNGAVDIEIRTVTLHGNLRWLKIRGNLFARNGNINSVCCVILDDTEKKTINEEFRNQNESMKRMLESDIFVDINLQTGNCSVRHDIAGKEFVLHDYSKKLQRYVYSEDRVAFFDTLETASKHMVTKTLELRLHIPLDEARKNEPDSRKNWRWYRAEIMSIFNEDGYISHILGRLTDIDAEKTAELLEIQKSQDELYIESEKEEKAPAKKRVRKKAKAESEASQVTEEKPKRTRKRKTKAETETKTETKTEGQEAEVKDTVQKKETEEPEDDRGSADQEPV